MGIKKDIKLEASFLMGRENYVRRQFTDEYRTGGGDREISLV